MCTFVLQNQNEDTIGVYIRLSDFKGGMDVQAEKVRQAVDNQQISYRFLKNSKKFKDYSKLSDCILVKWASTVEFQG